MRLKAWAFILSLAIIEITSPTSSIWSQSDKDENMVKNGSRVSLQYTLASEDGTLIESNEGREPLKFTQGQHEIILGLEKGLAGMKVGETKKVQVKPEEGYGPVRKEAFQEFPKEKIPPEGLKVGTVLTARGPQGQAMPVRVHEIKEKTVVLDLNHPMAGKTLVFVVKVLDIQASVISPPTAPAKSPQATQPTEPK